MSRQRSKSIGDRIKGVFGSNKNEGFTKARYSEITNKLEQPIISEDNTTRFVVKQHSRKGLGDERVLQLSEFGIRILNTFTDNVITEFPMKRIKQWTVTGLNNEFVTFTVRLDSDQRHQLKVQTANQGAEVAESIKYYIDQIMLRDAVQLPTGQTPTQSRKQKEGAKVIEVIENNFYQTSENPTNIKRQRSNTIEWDQHNIYSHMDGMEIAISSQTCNHKQIVTKDSRGKKRDNNMIEYIDIKALSYLH